MFSNLQLRVPRKWDAALVVALGEKDGYSREHSDRVCKICTELGKNLGLSVHDLHALILASLLHDIGKIGIPDSVLLKNGKLNDEEWEIMKSHSARGEHIFNSLELDDSEAIAGAIRSHHEHYNGKGYPDGLKGEDISVIARIIAITDSYDAMTTRRAYQHARTHSETMKIIKDESGTKMDPYIVSMFSKIIEHSDCRAN